MFPPDQPWTPHINWNTPAGQILLQFIAQLPATIPFHITVFGSTPLQLGVDASFLSADIDILAQEDCRDLIRQAGLGKGQSPLYIEQCDEIVFTASQPALRRRRAGYNLDAPPHKQELDGINSAPEE